MYWQAQTGFSVRLIGGSTLAPRPRNALLDAIATGDSTGQWPPPTAQRADALRQAAVELGTTVILDVPDPAEAARRAFLASVFGPADAARDGFEVWRVPTETEPLEASSLEPPARGG